MKKKITFLFISLFLITLSSCKAENGNNSIYDKKDYMDEKISTSQDYEEAKELADRIDDVSSVEELMDINYDEEDTRLTSSEKKKDKSGLVDVTDLMFSATNRNLGAESIEELEFGLETAKNCEKWCFDNHITTINEWEYWENNTGQVRILYDKEKKSFTWEKSCDAVPEFNAAMNKSPDDEPFMEYRKYTTHINNKNELEIHNINVMYKKTGDKTRYQFEFTYVENEYFKFTDYNTYENYTVNEERGTFPRRDFYTETYASLKENNKYVERLKFDARYNENDELVSRWVKYDSVDYLSDYVISNDWTDDDGWVFGFTKMYDYSCNELAIIEEVNGSIKEIKLNLCSIKNIKLFMDKFENQYYLYNSLDEEVSFDQGNQILEINKTNNDLECYISCSNTTGDEIDQWLVEKKLTSSGTKMLKNMCKSREDFKTKINLERFYEMYENRVMFDEKYRNESMKESDLPRFRSPNDVDCEIKGYVVLKDNTLDLSQLTIIIDKGKVFSEGTKWNFVMYLVDDNVHYDVFNVTGFYQVIDGKIVINDLGVYDVSNCRGIFDNKRTCLMMQTEDFAGAAKIKLCDIILDNSSGKLNGNSVPIDYNIVEWN